MKLFLAILATIPALLVLAQSDTSAASPTIVAPAEVQWADGPPSLPAGAQMVILEGHPGKSGPFTIRLKMPAGYRIPPHTHTVAERITVISGTVHLGIGEKFDGRGGRELHAGSFAVVPPRVPHFAWSSAEAILQIHSEGPFQRQFVDPADDSSSAAKK